MNGIFYLNNIRKKKNVKVKRNSNDDIVCMIVLVVIFYQNSLSINIFSFFLI